METYLLNTFSDRTVNNSYISLSKIIGIICLVSTFYSHSSTTFIFSNSYLKAILSSPFLSIECAVWAVTIVFTFPLD